MLTTEKRSIADLVANQLPDFYSQDGKNFIAFIEAYYEWMDIQQLNYKIADYQDIDTTLNKFLSHFRNEFLSLIPAKIAGDQRLLMKHVLDLYRSKGSKLGYKLLFRLLYNEDIEVYIPGDDMIAPSDGEWHEPYYLEITPNELNQSLIGRRIVGASSEAEAMVETYIRQVVNGKLVDIFYVSGKIGDFIIGEKIGDVDTIRSINVLEAPTILGSLSYISFIQGGQNFQEGQRLKVITGKGTTGEVRISRVANGTGTLLFTIVNGGTGYSMDAEEIISRTEAANASIRGRGAAFDIGALSNVKEITYDERLMFDVDDRYYANTTVNAVQVVSGGTGYSNASTVTFTNDRGIETIQVNVGGTGYKNTDTIVLSGGSGSNAVVNLSTYSNGTIHYVNINNIGKGYTSAPTVSITSNTGSGGILTAALTGATGSGAAGSVNTYSNGTIQSITVTNGGNGYQLPPKVTVSGGTGGSFTSNTYAHDYAFNPFFGVDANTLIGNGTPIQSKFFGTIAGLTNVAVGNNYQSAPNITVIDFLHTNTLPGNVFYSATSNVVVGVGTQFLTYFDANTANTELQKNKIQLIGSPLNDGNTEHRIITQVTNNTHMVLDDFPNYTANGEIKDVGISDGGAGYQNTDSVSVAGPGSGASLTITTDNFGTIIDVNILSRGSGWRSPPAVTVTSNTGSDANLISEIYYGSHKLALHLLEANYTVYETLEADQTNAGNNAVITGDPVFGTGIIQLGQVKDSGFGYEEDEIVTLAPYGAISTITIKSGGINYSNNEQIVVTGGGGGTGGKGFVTTNANGTITAVTLTSPGSGFIVPPTIKVRSVAGTGAQILCDVGGLNRDFYISGQAHLDGQGRALGQWTSTKGFLNADKYIQDSKYYQEYSYELRTGLTLSHYANIIKSIYHPAGTELFGSVVISSFIDNTLTEDSVSVTG